MEDEWFARADWYDTVRAYTIRLVGIHSVSPGPGEDNVTREIVSILTENGLESAYAEIGLDALSDDPHGRHNAYAYLPGASARTIILLGHIDTVATADYGPLEAYALDPDALAARRAELEAITPGLADVLGDHPEEWMFGRGTIDMKAGVAANIAVMRHLATLPQAERPVSAVLLATPDEENESAGVLQAVRFLTALRERRQLEYVGAINTDYTTARYTGDPHRYIYTGTIGKMLVTYFVVGGEGHAGDPFQGLDVNVLAAELIRDLSMNTELCERINDRVTPPPVTLRAADLKTHYDVQLPFTAFFHLNVLTFSKGPERALAELTQRARETMESALSRIEAAGSRWRYAQGVPAQSDAPASRQPTVLTYAELYEQVQARAGAEQVARHVAREWARWPADLDKRERALHLVEGLWALSGLPGPAAVLYFSPPYYPFVAATRCDLHDAMRHVVKAHPELALEIEEYYPYLSDMSYLRLDEGIQTAALAANMPVWAEQWDTTRAGGYSLPLAEIKALNVPVVNLGPYGGGAHQRGERLLMPYSFDALPRLICETIERLR
ncbi:MAG TPA: M20/M25/M40 family metallo-hydrolase [Ktedonobacterales bacterium]|nr:M20/M25/M40 family metallo-hydrolase [Ktedonobacterales bacterium]